VEKEEMYHTFNMGIGLVLAVKPEVADTIMSSKEIESFEPVVIGSINEGAGKVVLEF
jgi:phosphoribosylformylglycinamidine cyclo-ligase